MPIKFLVLGGVFWVLGGRGSADFIFMRAGIFLINICWKKEGLFQGIARESHNFCNEYSFRLSVCK